jgi:adenosylcobinamide amidohydrolase
VQNGGDRITMSDDGLMAVRSAREVDSAAVAPELHTIGSADALAVLCWSFAPAGIETLSSAPVGGGRCRIDWLLNIGVAADYARTDLDRHGAEVAAALGLGGTGAALLTALDVGHVQSVVDDGLRVDATVGVTRPTWAADVDGAFARWPTVASPAPGDPTGEVATTGYRPGTINVIAQLPVALTDAAAVNAVMTITEAKAQALIEAGVPGTGTASDAVVVCWPSVGAGEAQEVDRDRNGDTGGGTARGGAARDGADGCVAGAPEAFAGPRSMWGARLARATHAAVVAGLERH